MLIKMPLTMHLYNPLCNVAYDSLPLWSQSHWKGWLCFHLLAAPLPNNQVPCLVVYIVLLYCSCSKVYWKKTSIVTCKKKNYVCILFLLLNVVLVHPSQYTLPPKYKIGSYSTAQGLWQTQLDVCNIQIMKISAWWEIFHLQNLLLYGTLASHSVLTRT